MTIKKISNGIFDAAPAVLFISCGLGASINGISYFLHRDHLSKILFTACCLGMVTATVINKADMLFNNMADKNNCVEADVSKEA